MRDTFRIRAGYREACVSWKRVSDTCRIHAGYMQDTFRIHVQRMYLRAACGIHAKSMLDTACKHVSLGRSEGYVRIHAKYMQGLYSACILLVSCSDVWDTPVFYCILLVSCLYRVGYFVSRCHATFMCEDTFVFAPRVLYLDRIRWFPDSRTGIHPEYIRIHQNTSGYCIHRKPHQIS